MEETHNMNMTLGFNNAMHESFFSHQVIIAHWWHYLAINTQQKRKYVFHTQGMLPVTLEAWTQGMLPVTLGVWISLIYANN